VEKLLGTASAAVLVKHPPPLDFADTEEILTAPGPSDHAPVGWRKDVERQGVCVLDVILTARSQKMKD